MKTGHSEDDTQLELLKESIRRAEKKLEGITKPVEFDTFNSQSRILNKDDEKTRANTVQVMHEVNSLRATNDKLQQKCKYLEQQLEHCRNGLKQQEHAAKTFYQELETMKETTENQMSQLKKQVSLKQRIIEKYQLDLQKQQQSKNQTENYCRQLASQYNILLSSHNRHQQHEKQSCHRYQSKIQILSKQLLSIKEILLKQQEQKSTEKDDRKEKTLTQKNIELHQRNKALKCEIHNLKMLIEAYEKKVLAMRDQENILEEKLKHYEKNNEAILNEAAKNGLTLSHKKLMKSNSRTRCNSTRHSKHKNKENMEQLLMLKKRLR